MALTRPKAAQIDFDVTNLTDPLIGLNSGESGSADKDSGIVIERGSDTNVAFIWDESADQFAVVNTDETGTTSGNVTISSYADIKANSFYGDGSNLTGISGGGGAPNLNGLSDVTISSVQNNDLLKYNSTAGEWQNTNLGISVAPTLSVVSGTTYVGGAVVVNITNNASGGSNVYDDPHFFVQLKNSSNSVVVTNDNITYEYSSNQGKLSFTAPTTAGSYTLEVTAQDFGDLSSDVTTLSLTVNEIPAFRYMRLKGDGGSSHTYVQEFRAFDALAQSGTKYPPDLSSTNQGSTETVGGVDYVANSSGNFSSTYHDYKAFDSSASTGWWNLNPSSTYSDWFVSIDLGQSVSGIKSFQVFINQSYVGGSGNVVKVQISSTGNFSGEEITVGQYTPHLVDSTGINNAQRRFFIG